MLTELQKRLKSLLEQRAAITAKAVSEARGLTTEETNVRSALGTQIDALSDRVNELEAVEVREAAAAKSRVEHGEAGTELSASGLSLPGHASRFYASSTTYHRGDTSPSYFRDLRNAELGDWSAAERLHRNNSEVGLETRALGNTGGTGGSGGEFAPPAWLVEDFIKLARPGRVTADLFHREDLPSGASSVNLPRVATGTSTAIQSTQNTALSQTDLTTGALSSGISTIGGKQVVSQQMLEQSAVPFDRVVLEDLAADYARQLGTQVLTGSGTAGQLRGYLTPASTNIQTWTQAAPTASLFYSQLAKLQGAINTSRYASPDTVVMHPRRWAWFASYTDSTGRPLIVPDGGGQAFNGLAGPDANVAAGYVGHVLGMQAYTDPNIPTNLGAGTNQDVVLMFKRDDVWLWESTLRAETFRETYADTVGVLFRVFNYSAMIPDRYLASLGQLTGTGLVTPTFAG